MERVVVLLNGMPAVADEPPVGQLFVAESEMEHLGRSSVLLFMAQSLVQFETDHAVFTGWPLVARCDVGGLESDQGKDDGKRRKVRK
jgi:hypothetical protein